MRIATILLGAATFLLSSRNVLSTGVDPKMRRIRAIDSTNIQDEERANFKFDFSWWDDIAHKLPEQFQRMRTQPTYLETIFESWRQGWTTLDEAVTFMKKEGLSDKAIAQFKAAYKKYLEANPLF
ncbi:Secreted RxLR effector peptide protein [Phytophthora palmivora]|uniref:Secreted RxLR effector peptide protein n=1 Tax=Phytophthora palmivora TaxID=4796 RepID=A0A2P4YU08_9STRA|nr:Secreted RxLR effector peptide protein [Phytophthora palmivora]